MNRRGKVWMIIAAVLVVIGLGLFVCVMSLYHWDFSRLGTKKFEENTFEISERFSNIKINTKTADISFEVSDDKSCRVVTYDGEKVKYSVSVLDDALTVSVKDNRKWYDHIGILTRSPKVTVYLPEDEYEALAISESTGDIRLPKEFSFGNVDLNLSTGDVDCNAAVKGKLCIQASTGDLKVRNMSASEIDLTVSTGDVNVQSVSCAGKIAIRVSTGDVKLTDVTCGSLDSRGSTGDINLKNVLAEELVTIKRSTGNVKLSGSDAGELEIGTSTGDVTGSLRSSKIVLAKSDTGDIHVPEEVSGGKCKITTSTGDIRISFE